MRRNDMFEGSVIIRSSSIRKPSVNNGIGIYSYSINRHIVWFKQSLANGTI